jgi:heme/copper-type cytochrome/quinol oxidase subunit 2
MFQTKVVEKIKTYISWSIYIYFFFESVGVYEIMCKKYCTAGQATDDNMAHAHCVLDT